MTIRTFRLLWAAVAASVSCASALGAAAAVSADARPGANLAVVAAAARRTTPFDEVRPDPQAWHGLKRNLEVYAGLYDALRHCF